VLGKVYFIEVICDIPQLIEQNIRDVQSTSPDYEGWNPDDIVKDFRVKRHAELKQSLFR
jgi:hypothetical protein